MEYVVEMPNIRKEFPGTVANDNVILQLKKGEVHALLGENGVGESTLMGMFFGMHQPEAGVIKVKGKGVKISSPNVTNDLGIGTVHQHSKLVGNLTVAESIILGCEPKKFLAIDIKNAAKGTDELSKTYGLNVDPYSKIEDIPVGMQRRVEILKMLCRNAEVLIFDEPTAVLTPQEVDDLIKIMQNLINEGKSIIPITHKLKEIKTAADRCTVIRRGRCTGIADVKTTAEADMAKMMVRRQVSFRVDRVEANPGDEILGLENLSVKNNKKILGLKDFSLNVRKGEIVGVAGVEGNGQTELVEAITGMGGIESGSIFFSRKDISKIPMRKRIDEGIVHIPEDRHKRGLILDYTMEDNMVPRAYKNEPSSKNGLINRDKITEYANNIIETFDVRAGEGGKPMARSLSSGDQQKGIIGCEVQSDPDLLIAIQLIRGLDVGSIEYIHKRLVEQRDSGRTVLLVSLESDEILNVSDRTVIVNNGEFIGIVNAPETDENETGLMMAGTKRGEN